MTSVLQEEISPEELLKESYKTAKELLEENSGTLLVLTDALMKFKTLCKKFKYWSYHKISKIYFKIYRRR